MITNAAVVYLRLEAAAAAVVALDHEEWRWVIRTYPQNTPRFGIFPPGFDKTISFEFGGTDAYGFDRFTGRRQRLVQQSGHRGAYLWTHFNVGHEPRNGYELALLLALREERNLQRRHFCLGR